MLPAYAHLSGAFADFLAIVYDESTIDGLKAEMAETKSQIEALQPEIEASEKAFLEDREFAVEQLQFYADSGLDLWSAMMKNGGDAADLLGSQWQMGKSIEAYVESLNVLYIHYEELKGQQKSLQGHEQLLETIEKNLLAREQYLSENADLPLEQIANYLDIDWVSEVEYELIDALKRDGKLIDQALDKWLTASGESSLEESWLNEQSDLRYFFRNDHLYAEYELEFAHVILLGQVLQNEEGTAAELIFEAGFYNGFYLPEELLMELPGFTLDYAELQKEAGGKEPYVLQQDGKLDVHAK